MANHRTNETALHPASGGAEPRADLKALLLAKKTELIGEITEAMANQFNNIMMAITGYAELEMRKLPAGEKRNLEHVISNVTRATELVQKLLAIGRKRVASARPMDLNHLLNGVRALLEQLVGDGVTLTFALDPSAMAISADAAEVEQAVLSVAINARDAMAKHGELTITTKLADLAEDEVQDGERPGKYVLLSIDDTGSCAAGDHQSVPTSTALHNESKLNLALAAVRAIVDSSGLVRYSSEPGKGSSFKIYFPALEQGAAERLERNSPRNLPLARTILLVDDDEAVRVPAAEFLKMEGFKVLQAKTGPEAIHVVLNGRSSLDVLITDVVMPKMNGHELAEKLLELHPGLKVIYMSGDDRSPVSNVANGNVVTLRKPFHLNNLKDQIHELFGQ
jgi:two-component system, cell cycle sensor histidine kinase and response regulator CckA